MIQATVLHVKPKDMDSFLEPLFIELPKLQTGGLKVHSASGTFELKVHLMLASGDLVGTQELAHHMMYRAKFGCRICPLETITRPSPDGPGRGNYFRGSRDMLEDFRDIQQFKDGAIIRILSHL